MASFFVQCNEFLLQYVSLVRYDRIKLTHVRGFVFISKIQGLHGGIHIFGRVLDIFLE